MNELERQTIMLRPILLFLWCSATVIFPLNVCGQTVLNTVLNIVDADGKSVDRFAVMIHTADQGYKKWESGIDGSLDVSIHPYSKSAAIDVLVRAEGYASLRQRFQGPAKEALIQKGAKIVLNRGKEVRLQLQLPPGEKFPEGFLPEVYFPEMAWRVEMMWQPMNRQVESPDFNMLNVRPSNERPGEYVFRLPKQPREFILAIHHPGWLQFFKAGPFTKENCIDNALVVEIPSPASITACFEWGDLQVADLPFKGVHYQVMRQQHEGGNSYLSVASKTCSLDDTLLSLTDLAPGNYMLQVSTEPVETDPKETEKLLAGTDINRGRFFARRRLSLQPAQVVDEKLDYVPFDADANRGERTARVQVIDSDGLPAVGKPLKIGWFDGHYGSLSIFEGPIPDDGVVVLRGISDEVPTEAPFGPYHVEVDGEALGFFRVKKEDKPQEFSFRLVPKKGDLAPDVEFLAIESGEHLRLKSLRGKKVFIEFWRTNCGPCQPMMAKLNEQINTHGDEWQDKVIVLPVSLDANRENAADHIESRGWTNLRHFWSPRRDGEYRSDVARAFVIRGVPTALLVDREGRIVWRGHPALFDLAEEVAKTEEVARTDEK